MVVSASLNSGKEKHSESTARVVATPSSHKTSRICRCICVNIASLQRERLDGLILQHLPRLTVVPHLFAPSFSRHFAPSFSRPFAPSFSRLFAPSFPQLFAIHVVIQCALPIASDQVHRVPSPLIIFVRFYFLCQMMSLLHDARKPTSI